MDALRMKTSPWDIQGIECAVWAAEGKTVTLMDQNVYFHSDASGLLDDENGTYHTKEDEPTPFFQKLSCSVAKTGQSLDEGAVVPHHIPQRLQPRRITDRIRLTIWGYWRIGSMTHWPFVVK